jgi:hypothetical protein
MSKGVIKEYNANWNEWDDTKEDYRMRQYESEKNLRMCSICRK